MASWQATVRRAKGELVAGGVPDWFGQQQLVESWRRCVPMLGDPSNLHCIPTVPESHLDDTSLDLLREPLDGLTESLRDTGSALLLTDARGLVLERWFEDRSAGLHLDSVGSRRAADLSEGSAGTNAVSVAITAGMSASVVGSEHFSDFFSHSACVAEPIIDPVSAEALAVITLTAPMNPRIDLMRSWLTTIRIHLLGHLKQRLSRPSSLRIEETEEWALRQALAETGGDIARTCALLGLSRATVYRKIRRYRIAAPDRSSH
jgi:transcriptional regulator of acetoin/glycerol metabolism